MRKVLYILGKLDDADIDWMVEVGQRREVASGGVLIEEAERVEHLYILLDGSMVVTAKGAGDAPLATLGAGEILGELSFLDARSSSATVTAAEDCTLLSITRVALHDKLASDVGFAARLYKAFAVVLADRLRSTNVQAGSEEADDELGDELLDELSLAGSRFEWLLQRLRGRQ